MTATTDEQPLLLRNAHEFIGTQIAVTDWVDIDQEQVNAFGEVSRWRKPGHCDPESARKAPTAGRLFMVFTWCRFCRIFLKMPYLNQPMEHTH